MITIITQNFYINQFTVYLGAFIVRTMFVCKQERHYIFLYFFTQLSHQTSQHQRTFLPMNDQIGQSRAGLGQCPSEVQSRQAATNMGIGQTTTRPWWAVRPWQPAALGGPYAPMVANTPGSTLVVDGVVVNVKVCVPITI